MLNVLAADLPPAFHTKNWPTSSLEGAQELKDLVANKIYRLRIPPVFDELDQPVPPTLYRSRMVGAVVRVDFTLTHYHMTHKHTDNFIADVVQVRILTPAPKNTMRVVSPRKVVMPRKRGADGDIDKAGSTKRIKRDWYAE